MICPISNENLDNLKGFVIDKLDDLLDQKAPLSLKGLMASVYQEFGKTVDSDQALSFVQQVPTILREFMKADDGYQENFAASLSEIIAVQKQLDTDTPLKTTAAYVQESLGIEVKVVTKVNQQVSSKAGFTTVPQDSELEDPQAVTSKIKEDIAFNAMPPNPNSTTGSEVDNRGVPIPAKVQRYRFIRSVLAKMAKGEILESTDLPLVPGGIRLTAMVASKLEANKPAGVNNNDVVMVITDDTGKILLFNAEDELSEDGKPMYYGMRQVTSTVKPNGKTTITYNPPIMSPERVVKKRNIKGDPITLDEYKLTLRDDSEFLVQLNEYIKNNPDQMVMAVINGGSNGYIPYDETTITKLDDINFSDDPLNIQIQKSQVGPFYEGAAYFNVRGVSNPILISRKPMDKDLVAKLASTIVDTITDRNTSNEVYELSNTQKLDLILQYRANTNFFSVGVNEATDQIVVNIRGKSVEVTPENKETVRKEIVNFFTTPQPLEWRASDMAKVVDGNAPGFNPLTLKQGTIVRFGKGESAKYFKYIIPEFTINEGLLRDPQTFNNYSLEAAGDGTYRIVNRMGDSNGGMNYISFIKANSFVKYSKAPGDNKLRQANAYFTFRVPEEEKRKVLPVAEKVEETVKEEAAKEQVKTTKSAADQFIDDIENGLFKTTLVKTNEVKATPEQISKAKSWFDKHPLREHIEFNELFNAVNSEAVAQFFDGAITLYAGSNYSDLYHEGWHAFSQMFMTIDQKVSLYTELSKKSGSFVTNTGKRVTFSEATYQELEEYLAEDFREYMLTDGKTYKGKVRNSIFRKILNFLKSLFGNTTVQQQLINDQATSTVQELYEKLRVGNLSGYSFNASNVMFGKLNKGVEATTAQEPIQSLSPADSIEARKTIDSIFSSLQDELNLKTGKQYTNHIFRTVKGRMTAYSAALGKLKERQAQLVNQIESNTLEEGALNIAKRNLDTLNWMINNYGDPMDIKSYGEGAKGLIAYHNKKSEFLSYEDRGLEDAADNNIPERFKLAGNETSVHEAAKPEVLYMLRGLQKQKRTVVNGQVVYEPVLNRLGFPELVELTPVVNRLAKILHDSATPQEMHSRLLEEVRQTGNRFYYLNQLIAKLGDPSNPDPMVQDMWGAFWKTFNLYFINQPIVFMDNVDGQWKTRTGSSYGDKGSMKRLWDINFSMGNTESPYINRTAKSKAAVLNLDALLSRYPTQASIDADRALFIRDLGIPIDMTDMEMRKDLYDDPKFKDFGRYMLDRIKLLKKNNIVVADIKTFFGRSIMVGDKEFKENRLYNAIVDLFVKFSDTYSDASLSTPEGDKRYALSLNSSATAVAKGLNKAASFSEDVLSNHLSYLDFSRNPWAKRSWSLYSMFDPQTGYMRRMSGGKPTSNYLVENVTGLTILENGESVDLGINASSADETAMLMMNIAYFVQHGIIANPTPGEKSTRLSTRVSRYMYNEKTGKLSQSGKIWMDVEHFAAVNASTFSTKVYNSVLPYLLAEVDRIAIMKRAESNPEMIENNFEVYKQNGKDFLMFDQMISENTKKVITSLMEEEGFNLEAYLESNTDDAVNLRINISRDFMAYWTNEFNKTLSLYQKSGKITDDILGELVKGSASLKKYANFRENRNSRTELETAIVKGLVFNTFIHNTEATILNYGDPAQYATAVEFHKRIQMFSSSGEIFRTDTEMMGTLNQMLTTGYARSLGIDFKGSMEGGYFSNVLTSAIMDDPKMDSIYLKQIEDGLRKDITASWSKYRKDPEYLEKTEKQKKALIEAEVEKQTKAYKKMKIADAQGWITFDSYRLLAKSLNDWSPAQEALFQDIVSGKDVDIATTIKYFPINKYQYAGALATKSGLPVMAGHKFSLMPLIPNVIKSSPTLVALHEKMMRSNVDYATMKSGSKITTITHAGKMDQFYKDGNLVTREFDGDLNEDGTYAKPFMPNKVYMEFLKKQQPTNTEFKNSSIFATQLRKIIEEGLIEGGVPTDFMVEETDLDKKIKAWNGLNEEQKRKYPKYVLYTAYEKALTDLTAKKKEKLLKSIGWDTPEKYGKVNASLLEFLKKEMSRQDVSDHEVSYLDIMYNGALQYNDLSLHLSQELIEKVLLSIVNRNLIRQKINGEPLIQVSGLGWENMSEWKTGYNLTNPTQEQLDKFGTNGLTYYQAGKGPNGTTLAMTVKIALQGDFRKLLEHKHIDGNKIETLARLNEMVKNEQWLNTGNNKKMITMVAVRIPVQGLNSMEVMQVAEFLPEDAGNMVVLPAEIVAKSGSDFDIDKLSVYMPNIKSAKEVVSLESGNTEGAAENTLISSMIDILISPENYASLVRPNDTYTLDPIVNDEGTGIRDYVSDYSPKIGLNGEKLSKISGSDLMQYRYNLYVHVVNKVAQEALGIAAVDNTFNIMFNRVGAYMNKSYRDGTTAQMRLPKGGVMKDITLFMDHNTLTNENGEKVISLSHMMDALGQHKISDNISQVINLLLEIAKNDSAYYLQLNKEVIPTLLFLNQAGVPVKQAVYFAAHPVIREYMNEIRKARTPVSDVIGTTAQGDRNYFISSARTRIMQKYNMVTTSEQEARDNPYMIYLGPYMNAKGKHAHKNMYDTMMNLARNADGTSSEIAKNAFNATNLLDDIKNYNTEGPKAILTPEEQLILLHWFHIEDFAKPVRDIKLRLNFDTSRTKSAFMSANKKSMIESLAADKRIPYKVVSDILEFSPISSLYLVEESGNPFVMDLLEPLLPLRANPKVTAFLNSKLTSYAEVQEINDTFGNPDRFVNNFMNDLVSYIFQEKLRSFDISSIRGYRNLVVDGGVSVEKIPYLKFGAFVKDGVMYIDTKQLIKDFQEGNYLIPGSSATITGDNYQNRGLAALGNKTVFKSGDYRVDEVFSTPGEYFNFVLEREYIRSNTNLEAISTDKHFIDLRVVNNKDIAKHEGEDTEAYNKRIDGATYEQWIRDRALDNIGNGWKLFYSEDSYAKQVDDAMKRYGLREQEPLLDNIVIDEKEVRNPYDNKTVGVIKNLRLLDYDLTSEKIDGYYKIILDLANPAITKTDAMGNPLSKEDNRQLSELFARLPMVAFLQSGLNTTGPFSLTRLVPANKIMDFLSGAVSDYLKKIDLTGLEAFYSKFKILNGNYTLSKRYKHYTKGNIPALATRNKFTAMYGGVSIEGAVTVYGVSPFYGLYDTSKLNVNSAAKTAASFPDRLFVYEAATLETNPTVGSSGYFSPEKSKASNVIGIPTRLRFSTKEADSLSDDTLEENMLSIEKAIQQIKLQAKMKKLTFSDTGYGQNLLNTAPMTFMYLSQRLFEEFDYVNPKYDGQRLMDKVTPPTREQGNIMDVDLTTYLSEKKANLGKWKKDAEVMNNSQAAIGYPMIPTLAYESSSVAYAKALNEKGIKTGIQDFTGVKAVWVFGNLAGYGGITEAMLKPHFEGLYKDRIDEAIAAGVQIFNLGDAKSGIDKMAAEYLKAIGFRPVKHDKWTSWTREIENPIGELTFSPEMLAKIKSGQKVAMSGNVDLTPGLYKLSNGSTIRVATPITYRSLRDVTLAYGTAEKWAKNEGFDSFKDLKANTQSEFLKAFTKGAATNMKTYAITQELNPKEKAIEQANKLIDPDSVLFLEDDNNYVEYNNYQELLTAYENGEIAPELMDSAYQELRSVNLLKYLNYNPNQLSLSFPSESVKNGEILEPSEVLASKSVVSDNDVMEEIMRCITGGV